MMICPYILVLGRIYRAVNEGPALQPLIISFIG